MNHRVALEIVVWVQRLEYWLKLPPAAVNRLDYFCIRLLENNP